MKFIDEIINQEKINGKSKPLALTKSFTKKCKNLKIRYGRGNILVGKCPVGEASFGKVSSRGIVRSGIYLRGSASRGTVQSGNCPTINLLVW